MVYQIVYISKATTLFTDDELKNLLIVAREKNRNLSISGLLLYKDQSFIQLIEGPKQNVEGLYDTIINDSRHFRVKTLVRKNTESRAFHSWSMGFFNLDVDSVMPEGFTDYFANHRSLDNLVNSSDAALDLLAHFRVRS